MAARATKSSPSSRAAGTTSRSNAPSSSLVVTSRSSPLAYERTMNRRAGAAYTSAPQSVKPALYARYSYSTVFA